MKRKALVLIFVCLGFILNLTGCSSGGGAGSTVAGGGRGGTEFGFLTLSISDAPIDNATELQVQLDGVELMPASDSSPEDVIVIAFEEPKIIKLLKSDGSKSTPLLYNEILPTGSYHWLRLKITALNDGVLDTFIRLDDGSVHELEIPSDSEIGLQISDGVDIIANTPSAKTIVFDLRKSIDMSNPVDFKLEPTLNMVNDNETGAIQGTVRMKTLTSSTCSDSDPATDNVVYLYKDFHVVPDDIDKVEPEPFKSALVKLNSSTGTYDYNFDLVPYGKYTIVFSCQADLEDPKSDDAIKFSSTKNVNITNNVTKTLASNTFRFSKKSVLPGNVGDDDDD